MSLLRFGAFALDPDGAELVHGDARTALRPKVRDLLLYFLEHPGQVLRRDEVLAAVWPDAVVSDNALSFQISQLREHLGDAQGKLLETVPKIGYRWTEAPRRDWSREGEPPHEAPVTRVAVRAFEGDTALASQVGAGLAEAVRMQLGLYPELRVLAAESREAAEVTVEGGLRGRDGHLLLRGRAVDAGQRILWTGAIEVTKGDALALEERIAHELARALELPLERYTVQRLVAPATTDVAELYWRARALSRHGWTATREALLLLEQALALDPTFASARALKAQLLGLEVGYRVATDPEGNHRQALHEAELAVAAEPDNPYARSVLGGAQADCGRLDEGVREAAIARDLAPSRASIHALLGWLYRWAGLLEHARKAYSIAFRLEPAEWRAGVHLAYVLTLLGEERAARGPLEDLRRFGATAETASLEMQAWCAYGGERWTETRELLSALATREPVLNYGPRLQALLAARAGNLSPARAELERQRGYGDGRVRFDRAALHAAVGDENGALDELRAAEEHGFQAPQALCFDPDLRHLESRPEFRDLLGRWEGHRRARLAEWR